ncbi:MAG TPA: hypothetical protein VJR70_09380 [Stellaceae bacterium]|nr:hypothetical protein [Stellaceae bacterium]
MTLAEAGEIFAYWEQNPPAHLLLQAIARLLGWAPASESAPSETLAAAPPPGLAVARGGDLGMPAPLDAEALRARNRERALAIAHRNSAFNKR